MLVGFKHHIGSQEVVVLSRRSSRGVLLALVVIIASALVLSGCGKRAAVESTRFGLDATGKPIVTGTGSGDTTAAPAGTPGEKFPVPGKDAAAGGTGGTGSGGTASGGTGSGGSGGTRAPSGGGTPGGGSGGSTSTDPNAKTVRILWWNDTDAKAPVAPEVVFGSSSYKPKAGKSDVGSVGPAKIGQTLTLTIYPDGRSGAAIKATFELTKDMSSNSDVDAIHIEVSDSQVRVLGNAIPNLVQSFSR